MASKQLIEAVDNYENYISVDGIDSQVINAYIQACEMAMNVEEDVEFGLKCTKRTKEIIESFVKEKTGADVWELEKYSFEQGTPVELVNQYYSILLLEARERNLDSALQYIEKKREPKDRFYRPKRDCFMRIGLIQALQDSLDDKLDILTISMPPGTGKSTLEKFFHALICGWFPDDFNLFYSHSGDITRMYYDGIYDILTNTSEYAWNDIFPNYSVTNTNAKLEQININKYKPFPNVQCTSVGAKNAGKVRASKFLLCDDLIGGIEEALNKNRLDGLWNIYSVDARQRKIDGCKEIHIATRWSVHDVIGRLQRLYEDNDRCRFIAIPDIDPETNESNFDYEIGGFSVEFYNDQEKVMDEVSYKCLFKNEPIEREGLLYTEDSIRRYYDLPQREPDAILSVCDTKSKGADYFSMPVLYQYDSDYYLVDCLCNKDSDYEMQYNKVLDIICTHNIQTLEIEANMGGDRIAHEVSERLKAINQRCNITTKYTETNKETRIIVNAEWVKKHILFKAKEDYAPKSEYAEFMSQMLSYSVEGKNKHDDVVDSLANFVLFATREIFSSTVQAVKNPFWR